MLLQDFFLPFHPLLFCSSLLKLKEESESVKKIMSPQQCQAESKFIALKSFNT